jgi:hypothetical protein
MTTTNRGKALLLRTYVVSTDASMFEAKWRHLLVVGISRWFRHV